MQSGHCLQEVKMGTLFIALGFFVWLNIIVLVYAAKVVRKIRREALTGVCVLNKTIYFF